MGRNINNSILFILFSGGLLRLKREGNRLGILAYISRVLLFLLYRNVLKLHFTIEYRDFQNLTNYYRIHNMVLEKCSPLNNL